MNVNLKSTLINKIQKMIAIDLTNNEMINCNGY